MNSPTSNAGNHTHLVDEALENQSFIPRLSLVLYPDQVLRSVCQPVETFDSALRDLADEMLSLMQHHRGIGLAAPQVGLRHRLIVSRIQDHPLVLANLEVKDSTEPRDFIEGCLSLPGVQVNVRRPERIRVTGYDQHGQRRSFGAVGLWARVLQHELDHLNGVLICDYKQHETDQCQHCPLELPTKLIEQRKHRSRPNPRR
ncbi:MAG: peptide deformylase [Verrucomicrobiota bacterium]|nr:peptide deformylase [Verrucomicrobiota bacterium]MCC6821222.1 peptide deformylase [Limisphaerales bacterium]